jgi:hypothetical protein
MAKFSMTLRVDTHDHSPSAHRQQIEHALDQVRVDVGRGVLTSGDIVTPAVGAQPRRVVGEWQIIEDAKEPWDQLREVVGAGS